MAYGLNMEIIISVIVCFSLLVFSVMYLVISSLTIENQKMKYLQRSTLSEYLDLATMDQLFEEIKRRDQSPIILVKKTPNGILVDCFNITPVISVQILESSAILVREKIKKSMETDLDGID